MGKLICGRNSVMDALDGNMPIRKLFTISKLNFEVDKSIKVFHITKKEMDDMTDINHQGIIAELVEISYFSTDDILKDQPERILILDHIQDPHNFGAIIRSANAFGIKHIVFPKERAVDITETVMKVSSGGFVGIKFVKVGSLNSAITKLKKGGFWIYATAIENGSDINDVSFNFPMALIVGNEAKGISRPILKMSDQNVFIKMNGSVQSLNVSVATGIALSKTMNEK